MHDTNSARAKPGAKTAHWPLLALIGVTVMGCANQSPTRPAATAPTAAPLEIRTDQLAVRLLAILTEGAAATLVSAPGWSDYRIEITNVGDQPAMIRTVKLRDADGRYFASANSIADLSTPPDVASRVAGDVALQGVSIAAGQAVPYGGTIVGIFSGAARANAQQEQAERRRQFKLRNLQDVELAPSSRFTGSAYLPDIEGPVALAIDWRYVDGETQRIELPLAPAAAGSDRPIAAPR